jgi:predicted methyltransferase MtxX (methanogen marker protein 4)
LVINQFNKEEDFEMEGIQFERGDDYANFDLRCYFIKDEDFNHPFSVSASADIQDLEIEITYRPQDFPKHMNDLVAEIKETVEHELEHIEQKNFDDMRVPYEEVGDTNLDYLLSQEEIPAYVRGLIKRSKTKKISLSDAMDEWFEENKNKFDNPKKEWFQVKNVWMDYANRMKSKERVKKFK